MYKIGKFVNKFSSQMFHSNFFYVNLTQNEYIMLKNNINI